MLYCSPEEFYQQLKSCEKKDDEPVAQIIQILHDSHAIASKGNYKQNMKQCQDKISHIMNKLISDNIVPDFAKQFMDDLFLRARCSVQQKFKPSEANQVGSQYINSNNLLFFHDLIYNNEDQYIKEDEKAKVALRFYDLMLTMSLGYHDAKIDAMTSQ